MARTDVAEAPPRSDWRHNLPTPLTSFIGRERELEEAVLVRRAIGDAHLARTLVFLGLVAREREDYAAARAAFDEGLALGRQIDDRICIVHAYDCEGTVAHALGDFAAARTWYEQGLALAGEWDDQIERPWLCTSLAAWRSTRGT